MSAVVVTGPTVMQNRRSSLALAVIIASTHFAYPQRDGQAELAWVAGYIQKWFTHFGDGHPSKY